MAAASRTASPWSILLLTHLRGLVRPRRYLALGAAIALVYAIFSMLEGGMLEVYAPAPISTPATVIWTGWPWWNYPAFLLVTNRWAIELPFLATITMVVVSAGVGLGMAAAIRLVVRLARQRGEGQAAPAALGSVAGLTPAMLGLVLLGACCSISASALAGMTLVAQSSGSPLDNVLLNSWYLGLFQLAVLYVALVAQEELVALYGSLWGLAVGGAPERAPPVDRRAAAGIAIRAVLGIGGLTWLLAGFTAWFSFDSLAVGPPALSLVQAASLVGQHLIVGGAALTGALFPSAVRRIGPRLAALGANRVLRVIVGVAGVSVLGGVPPPWSATAPGLVNELLGALGAPARWGAVLPPSIGVAGLAFRWVVQFGIVGGFAVLAAAAPRRAVALLTVGTVPASAAPGPLVADAFDRTAPRPAPFVPDAAADETPGP